MCGRSINFPQSFQDQTFVSLTTSFFFSQYLWFQPSHQKHYWLHLEWAPYSCKVMPPRHYLSLIYLSYHITLWHVHKLKWYEPITSTIVMFCVTKFILFCHVCAFVCFFSVNCVFSTKIRLFCKINPKKTILNIHSLFLCLLEYKKWTQVSWLFKWQWDHKLPSQPFINQTWIMINHFQWNNTQT